MNPLAIRRLLLTVLIPTVTFWSVACKTFHTRPSIQDCPPEKILVVTPGGHEYVLEDWVFTEGVGIAGRGEWHQLGYPSEKPVLYNNLKIPADSIAAVKTYEPDFPRTVLFLAWVGSIAALIVGTLFIIWAKEQQTD